MLVGMQLLEILVEIMQVVAAGGPVEQDKVDQVDLLDHLDMVITLVDMVV